MNNFIALFMESAPWLLLGLLLAGILKMFVPMSWMQRQLGGHGLGSTVKAALLGAPLPLCSCGVIPAAVALRRSGASKAATTSFLVSTPETGVDSVTVSYVLLGPFMAVVRPIAAVCSAIVAGLLVGRDEATVQATAAEKPVTYKPVAATKFTPWLLPLLVAVAQQIRPAAQLSIHLRAVTVKPTMNRSYRMTAVAAVVAVAALIIKPIMKLS
ncbi:permease [Shewanella dokdonensis]|uniref:permease n=1 Tax=Shewanella dokdonensis TaxID=712036 RepID=UPI003CC7C74F